MNNNNESLKDFIDRFLKDTKDIRYSYKGLIISNLSLTNFKRNTDKIYQGKYYIDAFHNNYSVKLLLPHSVLRDAINDGHKINESVSVDVTINSVDFDLKGTILITISKISETGIGEQEIFERNLDNFCIENKIYNKPKRQLPTLVKKIGLISTVGSTTLDDIRKNLLYTKELDVFSVNSSSDEIAKIIIECQNNDYDVILLYRGGHQDKAMNIYSGIPVIKAVFDSKIHVGAALGHELDFPFIYKIVDSFYSTPTNFAQVTNEHNNKQLIKFNSVISNIGHYINLSKNQIINNYLSINTDYLGNILKHLYSDLELVESRIIKEISAVLHLKEKDLDNKYFTLSDICTTEINKSDKTLNYLYLNIESNIKENVQVLSTSCDNMINSNENQINSILGNLQSELEKRIFNIQNTCTKISSELEIKKNKKRHMITSIVIIVILIFALLFIYINK